MRNFSCIRCGGKSEYYGKTIVRRCRSCGMTVVIRNTGAFAYFGQRNTHDVGGVWVDIPEGCLLILGEQEL